MWLWLQWKKRSLNRAQSGELVGRPSRRHVHSADCCICACRLKVSNRDSVKSSRETGTALQSNNLGIIFQLKSRSTNWKEQNKQLSINKMPTTVKEGNAGRWRTLVLKPEFTPKPLYNERNPTCHISGTITQEATNTSAPWATFCWGYCRCNTPSSHVVTTDTFSTEGYSERFYSLETGNKVNNL